MTVTERERIEARLIAERRAYLQALDANHLDECCFHEALIDECLDNLLHLTLTEPEAST